MAWRGWRYLRLDGATSAAERAEAVAQFNRPGSMPMQADAAVDYHTGSWAAQVAQQTLHLLQSCRAPSHSKLCQSKNTAKVVQ